MHVSKHSMWRFFFCVYGIYELWSKQNLRFVSSLVACTETIWIQPVLRPESPSFFSLGYSKDTIKLLCSKQQMAKNTWSEPAAFIRFQAPDITHTRAYMHKFPAWMKLDRTWSLLLDGLLVALVPALLYFSFMWSRLWVGCFWLHSQGVCGCTALHVDLGPGSLLILKSSFQNSIGDPNIAAPAITSTYSNIIQQKKSW